MTYQNWQGLTNNSHNTLLVGRTALTTIPYCDYNIFRYDTVLFAAIKSLVLSASYAGHKMAF